MKETGSLYEVGGADVAGGTWGGPVEMCASEENVKNEYLKDLDKMDDGKMEVSQSINLISIMNIN